MKLSADVVIEALSGLVLDSVFSYSEVPEFTGVRIFTGRERVLDNSTLYICSSKLLYSSNRGLFDEGCFVIRSCPFDYQPANAIILSESCDMYEASNRLIELFDKANYFERKIKEAAGMRKGYEPFIEVAREMLPHCVVVLTDSAYTLLGATTNSVPQLPYLNAIVERGFYNKTDLDLMAEKGYFADERKYKVPILYGADHTISGVPFLVRSYRMFGATASFMGCYFIKSPPSGLDIALFRCLTDEVGEYMTANGMYDGGLPTKQRMIDDLITERRKDPDFFYDRCAKLRIPFEGEFRLGVLQLISDNGSTVKAAQIANQLSTFCFVHNYGVFQYISSVIILFRDWHNYDVKEMSTFSENWQSLERTIVANKAYMGVSLGFTTMEQFATAYKQAINSAVQGRQYGAGQCVYYYSEYYIYDMLQKYDETIPLQSVYTSYLDELDDGKGGTFSNLELLYVYLISERNIALTARRVHMHRNGVLYRIQKIHDTLKLDLDSADVRLRLMISFKILELKGRIKLGPFNDSDEGNGVSRKE